ncbi:MAG: hypothetical protein AABW67_04425 [Nanoarchaeota archaeon]
MKNKYKDYEIPFWGEWLEADCLKRSDMIEKLPVVKELSEMGKLPEKIRRHTFALMLNSFFEDLESAIYTKNSLEKSKKRN